MSDPLVDPSDLGTYLSDDKINQDRALLMIGLAQELCESVVADLPDTARGVVLRVAARAYTTTLVSRKGQMQDAGSPYGGGGAGLCLTDEDVVDLRRITGSGGAFSIDLLPADYAVVLPPWDVSPGWDVA
jgi:hypothetical protein